MMKQTHNHPELTPHWLLSGVLVAVLIAYLVVCQIWGEQIRHYLDESQRILIRSIFYGITIILFPVVKLLRYILIRLNQTMPGDQPAGQRYFMTVAVCLLLVETVGVFGFLMFIFGDGFNTLYIFTGLAALGVFLHMPKLPEYLAICAALDAKNER